MAGIGTGTRNLERGTARCALLVLVGWVALAGAAGAQQQPLTVEAIYSPASKADIGVAPAPEYTWLDADHYLVTRTGAGGRREWVKVEAATGGEAPLFTAAPDEEGLTFDAAATRMLFRKDDDLHVRDLASGTTTRLTNAAGTEDEPTFSPDGTLVAFVRASNLFVVDVASQKERQITTDGSDELLNGKLDWVYQEEIYGRGRFRAYWWSPDSKNLAFLQINDAPVPDYTVTDHIPYHPVLEVTAYPKSGDPNPTVKLAIVGAAAGEPRWIDLSTYTSDFLVVDVGWTPDSSRVTYQVQDREQTWLDLNFADAATGAPQRVLRETTKAWVNNLGSPVWLKDGTFLWLSERTGFSHLYRYNADGTLVKQITDGHWDVRSFLGVDEKAGVAFALTSAHSPIANQVDRIALDSGALTRLSRAEGTHRATLFNPAYTRYIDAWSTTTMPWQTRLHRADGVEVRIIDANPAPALAQFKLTTPEFLQVKTRDGFVMEAMMIRPPDFDPTRRYPVFQHTYGGPGAQQVVNKWDGQAGLFYQLLARNGIIVWICDNRSASAKGVESQWPIHGRLGELELRDIEDGVAWLKQQPYVDGSRIAIEGWSYGGFMSSYALTHSTSFAAGVVGAPVTDWRNYDSVYTERYMKTPQNNADGYAATAPAKAAASLHGRMLLLHGTTDDNVHFQNSVQLVYELQRAGKPFEMMMYPRSRHGITDDRLVTHLRQLMFDFVLRTIGSKRGVAPTPTAAR